MTAPKKDIQFSVAAGAKIVSVTDSSTAVTHGTPIDINIKSFTASPQVFEAEQRHDGKFADRYIELEKFSGQFVMSKIDLEVLGLLTGNSVETTGNDQLLEFDVNNLPGYFAVGVKSKYSPAGTVGSKNYVFHRCKATAVDMGGGDREYGDMTITFDALPREYDDKVGYIKFCKTDTAISFSDLS
jgi:hypothetical protein